MWFLLYAAGIGDHERGMALQTEKFQIGQRFAEAQASIGGCLGTKRIEALACSGVDGEDHVQMLTQIGKSREHAGQPRDIVHIGRAM